MSNNEIVIALIVIWLVGAFINSGFVYADFRGRWPILNSPRDIREDTGMAILFSLLPVVGWIVTLFVTGFYYHGWKLPGSEP